ncbi:MAG: hypothetical protein ACOXZ0_06960 [Eubacteriales bacterium]|jgi:hypothetical protein
MAKDIVPELLEAIERDFQKRWDSNKKIKRIAKLIEDGTATYSEANEYAIEVGEMLVDAYNKNISAEVLPDEKMYYNIAQRILEPTMSNNHELISTAAAQIQTNLNKQAGIGIKGIKAPLDKDRISGIVNKISAENDFKKVKWMLDEPIINFSQSIVDDTAKANIEFHDKAGLVPKVTRTVVGGCCEWCAAKAGTYTAPNIPKDIYQRHRYCRCTIEYDPGDGKKRRIGDKERVDPDKNVKIEARRKFGIKDNITNDKGLAGNILRRPKILGTYTPKTLKTSLEKNGYIVKSLGDGNLKGVSFEEGGGYRVNFDGDGIILYHPAKKSHHKGAYYKMGNGKIGIKRYDMKGKEIG